MHLPIIELKELLYCNCILTTLLQNKAQYLKTFVLSKVLNVVLLVPPFLWFTMDLQTGHSQDRYHVRIILFLSFTMKFFSILFLRSGKKKLGGI